jgi:hypothetical protein
MSKVLESTEVQERNQVNICFCLFFYIYIFFVFNSNLSPQRQRRRLQQRNEQDAPAVLAEEQQGSRASLSPGGPRLQDERQLQVSIP